MTAGFLVDTNIPSELTKPHPNPRLKAWADAQLTKALHLSVISIGEIQKGIAMLPVCRRRTQLEFWLANNLIPLFDDRILPVTLAISSRWGRLTAEYKAVGKSVGTSDSLIAATALEHGLTIATRNVKDFAGIGVTVLNPWD